MPDVQIVALCDPSEAAAFKRKQAFAPEARVYTNLPTLLQHEQLDFVDVATPPDAHVLPCTQVLESGRHVICQKPLAPSSAEAQALDRLARERALCLAVHENHRFRPWFREVLTRHHQGRFGRVAAVRWQQWDASAPAEVFKLEGARGVLFEYGTHMVDMMLALLGEPEGVEARLSRVNPQVKGESHVHASFRYPHTVVTIDLAWKPTPPASGCFHLLGDRVEAFYEGSMTRGPSSRFRVVCDGQLVTDDERDPTRDYAESFFLYQAAFVDALRAGAPFMAPVSARQGARALAWVEAAYEASRLRKDFAPGPWPASDF